MTSSNSQSRRLDNLLSNWQSMPLSQQPKLVKTFTAGLNHETHLIAAGNMEYVLKRFTRPAKSALLAQHWAAQHGLAPDIIYTNQSNDVALIEYLSSNSLSGKGIRDYKLTLLAKALAELHSIDASEITEQLGDFDLLGFCRRYLAKLDSADITTPRMHNLLLPALELFSKDTTSWCISHNDLVPENCFIVDDKALFIDWEYAQRHNPWFDLAAIIYYFDLSAQQSHLFIKQYRPEWLEKIHQPIFCAAQIALLWGDILWHLARGGRSAWPKSNPPNLDQKFEDLQTLARAMQITI